MNNPGTMRIVERIGYIAGNPHGLIDGQLCLAIEPGAQRLAIDEGHHVVEEPIGRATVEQRQNLRMLQRRRRRNLLHEALGAQHGRELRPEHFHRDPAFVLEIVGKVDGCHAACAELALDVIAAGERRAETIGFVAHSTLAVEAGMIGPSACRGACRLQRCHARGRTATPL